MSTRENLVDRADREARRILTTIGREIREARMAAGLSQGALARAAGISHSQVSRLERGLVGSASVRVLARLCEVAGLDLSVRAYPGGDPIRDAAQVRLLARFRQLLHPSLRWRTEVPLPMAGDQRAWDGVIIGPAWSVAVEAETRLTDAQALARRLALKERDGGLDRLILLLADTRANRSTLRAARPALGDAFPIRQGPILAAIARGEEPAGYGTVLL
jgi:transcriptional regulator with XRE-family HTH domain